MNDPYVNREAVIEHAREHAPEAVADAVENGAVPVGVINDVLLEIEDQAERQAASGEVPGMFKTGVLTACAGVRQQLGITELEDFGEDG